MRENCDKSKEARVRRAKMTESYVKCSHYPVQSVARSISIAASNAKKAYALS